MTSTQPRVSFWHSIRTRLPLIIALMALTPLLVLSIISYLQVQRLLSDQVENTMAASANAAIRRLDEDVQIRNIRLASFIERNNTSSTIQKALTAPLFSSKYNILRDAFIGQFEKVRLFHDTLIFEHIAIVEINGTVRLGSNPSWTGIDFSVNPQFEFLKSAPAGTYVLHNLPPFYGDEVVLVTTYKGYSQSGQLQWIALAFSRGTSIAQLLRTASEFQTKARAYFVTAEGEFIGINPRTLESQPFLPSPEQRTTWDNFIASGTNFSTQSATAEGEAAINYLAVPENLNVTLVLELPRQVVFGTLDATTPVMIGLFLLAAILTGILATAIGRYLTIPVLNLVEVQQDFAAGNFDRRAPVGRNDELGLLASTFNKMAADLTSLYRSLEERVRERTTQIRTAAEIAQTITISQDLHSLLNKTVTLLVEQFDFYHAGIFLLDPAGQYAQLTAAKGPADEIMLQQAHKLPVNSQSIVGWVSANNRPRVVSDVENDPIHFKNPLLPETRAEAGIPISVGDVVLGVLDVQSIHPDVFTEEMVTTLTILANQLASALYNLQLRTTTEADLTLIDRLNRATYAIVTAENYDELQQAVYQMLRNLEYPGIWLRVYENDTVQPLHSWDPLRNTPLLPPERREKISTDALRTVFANGLIESPLKDKPLPTLPIALVQLARETGTDYGVFVPVFVQDRLHSVLIFGNGRPTPESLLRAKHAIGLAISATEQRIQQQTDILRRLRENEAIIQLTRLLVGAPDMETLFQTLHKQVSQTLGDYAFLVALHDQESNSIRIPYLYENGVVSSLETYPADEGLIATLLRIRQPLLLVHNAAEKARELGARVVGEPAKSWLGVPLIAHDQAIGAIVVQDLEHEGAFTENDLHFLEAVAGSVAGVIQNIRLIEAARQRALDVQTASEIARDISKAISLDELLQKAVALIPQRFNLYHAAIFLLDEKREFAVIREGTGNVGQKMKQMGHKLAVGSKSTVGYASGRGEMLVINDTLADATHRPNPLLPDTRAEAAIPLKVGDRIIGVLDVQSTEPYSFTPDKLRTLQVLADQLAIAIENAELFTRMQENLSQQRLLHNITAQATGSASLEDALDMAVQGLQVTLGGDRVSILLLDNQKQTLRVVAARGYSESEMRRMVIPLGRGITGWAAKTKQSLYIEDVRQDPRYISIPGVEIRSELAIPLLYRNEVLGVLNIETEHEAGFDANTREILETMASNLAAIIANARLIERIRQQANRQRMLYEATLKLRRATSIEAVLRATTQELALALNATRAEIRIQPPEDSTGEEV